MRSPGEDSLSQETPQNCSLKSNVSSGWVMVVVVGWVLQSWLSDHSKSLGTLKVWAWGYKFALAQF